jgi:anti-anti-sigma factor
MTTATFAIFQVNDTLLSAHNTHKLLTWVNHVLETGQKTLLIDLEQTAFMDSSGLGALVTAAKNAKAASATLSLCSLNGQARLLLEMTEMQSMFEIFANPEDFCNVS